MALELEGYLSEPEHLEGELTIPKQLGGSTLGTKTITENDTYYAEDDGLDGYSEVTVNVSGGSTPTLETVTKTYTPTTSQQTETITPSSGYDGIGEVDVTVDAMPTGTEGTPTATKGAVSNHSVNVTPSVTNVAGYIAGGTKTGTAVTVSASELDSGTKSITANGNNQDVVGYAAVDVAVPNSYSASDEGKVVSNGALVAQTSDTVTANDTYDTTLINSLTVNVSGGGTEEAPFNDVCFWDYDGTCLYSYSASEFANLSELPTNPSHSGLTAQGWNWSLADAKAHVAEHGFLDIGQLYVTSDGKTHIHIAVDNTDRMTRFIGLKCSVANSLTIEWGDNSATETNTSTSYSVYTHEYASVGNYEIKISVSSGTMTLGNGSAASALMRNNTAQSYWSQASIKAIEIGNNVAFSTDCFNSASGCETLTIPTSVSYSNNNSYFSTTGLKMLILPKAYGYNSPGNFTRYCGKAICFAKQDHLRGEFSSAMAYSLKRLCVPVYPVGNQMFRETPNMERFIISASATQFRTQFLTQPYSIVKLIFPSTFTNINGLENYFYSLKEIHCKAAAPPTLSGTYFNSAPSDLVIYVPYSADHSVLEAYKTASNWSTYASKMQEETQ